MPPATVLQEDHDAVRVLRWNRPDKRNAITAAMYSAMADHLHKSETNPHVRAVVLMGHAKAFSAGNDLDDFARFPPEGANAPVLRFLRALAQFSKPLLGAVRGMAVGVGTTMLLHCDLVYAAEDARFSLPFAQLGLCPEAASSLLLPRLMGHPRAAELLLLGDPFSAAEAWKMGLLNGVLLSEEVESKALLQASRLALMPADALAITKALLKRPQSESLADRIDIEAQQFAQLLNGPAAKEALLAFAEKRPPVFNRPA